LAVCGSDDAGERTSRIRTVARYAMKGMSNDRD
jgi:hypothetical protein